ncbi:MAG: hypothetical protein WCX31_03025 [Salinivirgaceae bacterium]
MVAIAIVGIIVVFIGFVLEKSNSPFRTSHRLVKMIGVILVLIGLLVASVVQIEPGQVGVQKLFGKVNKTFSKVG